ncbi:phospholipase [Ramlibacter sp. USB13]|uniref:Phospholipase n=1 Tax=Ramlibacter cellulosilyticus TaxID=2764187 RepID=A0A923MW55_9BURK|nr:SGNH/GDSL hydrolase family protein [Ramlibacter cellulosilyticus]MBC5785239.1 phospholipase [Ramlibacter cellulosilyticus]
MQTGRRLRLLAAAFAAAAVLAGCGGGGGTEGPKTQISRVIVAGDSLADVGVTGIKFTVQNSADPAGFPVFPQIVASNFGVTSQCNYFTTTAATNAGCTNYAIGGGRIRGIGAAPDIQDVPTQLAVAAQVNGTYKPTDLLIVDGGGNDAADLVGAYLGAGSNPAAYQSVLLRLLTPQEIGTAGSPEAANALWMQKLADRYYGAIKTNALDKGATHVAVLDIVDITLTPRFQQVLAGVTQQAGAARAQQLQGAIRQWITVFNDRLRSLAGGDARIAVVPFYADFQDQVAHPATYGISNATTPACPVTGVSGGLPSYTFTTCTSAALDAAPPTGQSAGWWQSYAFSDSFHPTPFGHRLLASSVSRALARAGWL